jgi:hypothetical protein
MATIMQLWLAVSAHVPFVRVNGPHMASPVRQRSAAAHEAMRKNRATRRRRPTTAEAEFDGG